MGAVASPNKPDLCIHVDCQGTVIELAFCKFSALLMGPRSIMMIGESLCTHVKMALVYSVTYVLKEKKL